MAKRDASLPGVVVEVLRLCVVVFSGGVGYFVAQMFDHPGVRLGPFEATGVGILLGAAE